MTPASLINILTRLPQRQGGYLPGKERVFGKQELFEYILGGYWSVVIVTNYKATSVVKLFAKATI